jgi:tetratricopeptide (TPR) repeat protein
MGDVVSAEEYVRSALYMHQTNEMNHGRDPDTSSAVARCLHSLGMVRVVDVKSALHTLQRAADVYDRFDPVQLSSVLDSMGSIYFQGGDLEMAMVYHTDAYKIKVTAVGRRHISLVSNCKNLGRVYMARGRYNGATSCYTRAEALLAKEHRQHRDNTALAAGLAGQLEEVQELVASAVAQREEARTGLTLYV